MNLAESMAETVTDLAAGGEQAHDAVPRALSLAIVAWQVCGEVRGSHRFHPVASLLTSAHTAGSARRAAWNHCSPAPRREARGR